FPAVSGTFSCSWLFVILGIAELDRTEAMIIAAGAAAAQTLLNVREKPTMMQLVFNIAALGVSTSAATIIHALAGGCGLGPVPALLLTAAGYYAINALVVTGVLALLHAQNVRRLWVAWMRWTTPAFVVSGAAAAGLFVI